MFDVTWSDPDQELVGEHRAKKELKREQRDKEKKRGSQSTARSSRSSSDSPFSFLRSHGLKRINTSDANTSPKSTVSSQLASPTESSARSPLSPTFDIQSHLDSEVAVTRTSFDPSLLELRPEKDNANSPKRDDDRISPGLSRHDSVFSKYAESDVESPRMIPPSLSSDKCRGQAILNQSEQTVLSINEQSHATKLFPDCDAENGSLDDETSALSGPDALRMALQEQSFVLTEGLSAEVVPSSICRPLAITKPRHCHKINDPAMWKSLREWSLEDDKKAIKSSVAPSDDAPRLQQLPALTFEAQSRVASWRQHLDHLARFNFEQLLSEFTNLAYMVPCTTTHEESEAKLKLMMLWTLNHLDPILGGTRLSSHVGLPSTQTQISHLALYESQETVAYLSVSFPNYEISHLSPSPLSAEFSPNIRPLPVGAANATHIPCEVDKFDIVSCFGLSSSFPETDIPGMLKSIHKCLKPGGTLQVTLIDPLPRAATLGPHLRRWIRNNLLSNLEKKKRCTNPIKLFPQLLADASLRGRGSSITTSRFYAIPTCVINSRKAAEDSGPTLGKAHDEKLVKAEIRSQVGRLLFKEVWGPFVTVSEWWWDDPICVEECVELGTVWECYLIESRKI